ncbi:molecular chaperone HscB [Pancytospora epiphaga]|nr:molecular chaperone HscB [Pancytospora epiphaga]
MLDKSVKFFRAFNLEPKYDIDKNKLKQSYYTLSKSAHPDMLHAKTSQLNSTCLDSAFLNTAYLNLKDDFLRAKLFTTAENKISQDFLESCLKLEEQIENGEDIGVFLDKRIEECKRHYNDSKWLARWGYYVRLKDLLKERLKVK